MSFNCPNCQGANTLYISKSITLPPDSRSDDIILQIVRCDRCKFSAAAVYEESRRGNPDSESWDHRGYRISEIELARLKALIERCPTTKNKRCSCASHKTLGNRDTNGRWQPPFSIDWRESFPLVK